MAEAPTKKQMFEAEMANQQLERIQEYMQRLEKQVAEVLAMKEALDNLQHIKENDEMLVPMAAGVFMKAKAAKERTLLVNVGQGVIVPKDAQGVHAMLDEQLSDMRKYEEQLQREFDTNLAQLQEIERRLK
jgi:prefoldin alpha subunit